ncbi:hypothetical protein BGX26_009686 [Mortierella sp. AD094]|nr:hypothetical protein BGX26_009686 [Mortierella sp. AD094]
MSLLKSLHAKTLQSLNRSSSKTKVTKVKNLDSRVQRLPQDASHLSLGPTVNPLLFMPEILDSVFSHLDHKSILSVRLVCQQWSMIARRYLTLKAQWRNIMSDTEKAKVIANLSEFDTVEYTSDNPLTVLDEVMRRNGITSSDDGSSVKRTSNSMTTQPNQLLEAIRALASANNNNNNNNNSNNPGRQKKREGNSIGYRDIRLRNLVLIIARGSSERLHDPIYAIPTLTSLEILCPKNVNIELYNLLMSCPNLKHLFIDNALLGETTWQPQTPSSGPGSTVLQDAILATTEKSETNIDSQSNHSNTSTKVTVFILETLSINLLMMPQKTLQSLCDALPNLLSLNIRYLQPTLSTEENQGEFNRRGFYESLARSCPRLRSLHLSLRFTEQTLEESEAMRQCFPELKELSMIDRDLISRDPGRPQINVLEHYANHLTKLEIICHFESQITKFLDKLHHFLCNAQHLKHLVAPGVQYWTEYLDLVEDDQDEQIYYRPRNITYRQSQGWRLKFRVWACRKLETLHLGFGERFGSSTHSEYSRVVFGYISRHCPGLKDLCVTRNMLNLYVEGGLCLLTRLKDLEKLRVVSNTANFHLDATDVNWIGCYKTHSKTPATLLITNEMTVAATTSKTTTTKSVMLATIKSDVKRRVGGSISNIVPRLVRRDKTGKSKFSAAISLEQVANVFMRDEIWYSTYQKQQASDSSEIPMAPEIIETSPTMEIEAVYETLPFAYPSESVYPCWPNLRLFTLAVDSKNLFNNSEDKHLIQSLRPDINFSIQQ